METRTTKTSPSLSLATVALTALLGGVMVVSFGFAGGATEVELMHEEGQSAIGPGPTYPTGNYVGVEEPLRAGDLVLVQDGQHWWNAIVLGEKGHDAISVRFLGWGGEAEKFVSREMLQWPQRRDGARQPRLCGMEVRVVSRTPQPMIDVYEGTLVSINQDLVVIEDLEAKNLIAVPMSDIKSITARQSTMQPIIPGSGSGGGGRGGGR